MRIPRLSRRALGAAGVTLSLPLVLAACSSSSSGHDMSGMKDHGSASSSTSAMPGMGDMPAGNGLRTSASGFRLAAASTSLPPDASSQLRFQILDAGGMPVTRFEPEQTKLMHFYLIRSDLTGFQHVHPVMAAAEGTWTADLAAAQSGTYRTYASFIAKDASGKALPLVLGQEITVPGTPVTQPLPAPSTTTTADGYMLMLSGEPMAGMAETLTVTVSKAGQPVTDLQPYLDTYAHLTAFHEGDMAFAHLHPHGMVSGDRGGPKLTFDAMLGSSGNYRLFLQFQTNGALHTAAVTLHVK